MKNNWSSFEDAREFIQSQNLQSKTEWEEYCKSGKKPEDIPTDPSKTYEKKWINWGDWLRNGKPITRKTKFYSFKDAKEFVQTQNLKNANDWREYCTSGNKPNYITSVPERVYKNKGWAGLGDWLGTETLSSRNRKYRSFAESKKFVHALKLKSETEWNEYCKSGNKPDDIPQSAKNIYKKEYQSMGDWLGTGRVADQKKMYRSLEETTKFAQSLKLKNVHEWEQYSRSGNKPADIHPNPSRKYKNKGWISWGNFLGTENIGNLKKSQEFLSYQDAKKFIRTLGLKSQQDWLDYCNSGNRPANIPSNPQQVYSKKRKSK